MMSVIQQCPCWHTSATMMSGTSTSRSSSGRVVAVKGAVEVVVAVVAAVVVVVEVVVVVVIVAVVSRGSLAVALR